MVADPTLLDAVGQAGLIGRGELHPTELVEATIARVERTNPTVNAVIIPLYDKALAAAGSPRLPDGPLRGVPLLLKDALCYTAGDPYHLGMQLLKDLGWTEDHDTRLAGRFRRAGLILLGKTNTPELAASATTEPAAYGPTRNPWDPSRSPGGSSGGSAAAVAARMAPVAYGNDMVGSIRIPAACCGLVGLKPTRGRITLGSRFPDHWWRLTHHGVLTRTVRDTATVLDAVGDPAPGRPRPASGAPTDSLHHGTHPLRIGLRTELPFEAGEPHEECAEAVRLTGRLLEELGHHVHWSGPGALDHPGTEVGDHLMGVLWVALARELERWSARTGRTIGPDDVEPGTWSQAEAGSRISDERLSGSTDRLQGFAGRLTGWWQDEGFDLLVTPTLPDLPPPLGSRSPFAGGLPRPIAFTAPFNLTGQPAVSLPVAESHGGLPVGVQLVAAVGREDLLLGVGAALEEMLSWADRRPPIGSGPARWE